MSWRGYGYGGWRPYVSVAERQAKAARTLEGLRKKGLDVQPIKLSGQKIARTFWGEAWCEHLERFSDYANRLPRGRTYVRNGSVCHLAIEKGKIEAKVCGSELYTVKITIQTLPPAKWKSLKTRCAGQVGSLLELLQGKLSDRVMTLVMDRDEGLFPSPKEIKLSCSCPDWATMCKHVAAVLYGVGARLDEKPELLFLLRGVDHGELVSTDTAQAVVAKGSRSKARTLDAASLSDVFGIDMAPSETVAAIKPAKKSRAKPVVAAVKAVKAVPPTVKPTRASKSKKAAASEPKSAPTKPAATAKKPSGKQLKPRAKAKP
jgi:uncharacterized Zn finger protein